MAVVKVTVSVRDFEIQMNRSPNSDELDGDGNAILIFSVLPRYSGDDESVIFEIGNRLKIPQERWSIDWDNIDWKNG